MHCLDARSAQSSQARQEGLGCLIIARFHELLISTEKLVDWGALWMPISLRTWRQTARFRAPFRCYHLHSFTPGHSTVNVLSAPRAMKTFSIENSNLFRQS